MAAVRALGWLAALLATGLAVSAVESRLPASDPEGAPAREGNQIVAGEAAEGSSPDSLLAARFLTGMKGTGPLACGMAIRSLGVGWGWRGIGPVPNASEEQRRLLSWAARRPGDTAVEPLRVGLESPDRCVRRMAARMLGRMRHERATRALLRALSAPDPTTRRLAAIGLGYAEDHSTLEALLTALRDDEAQVRAASAWALGAIEDDRAIPALTRLVLEDPDPVVRRAAAMAIGSLY